MIPRCGFHLRFLVADDVEHVFTCLLAICVLSFGKCLSLLYVLSFSRLDFFLLSFESPFYFLVTGPLSDVRFAM